VKAKNLVQTSAKFCEVFALKLPPFFVQNGSVLFVGCACTFIICHPPNLHCVLSICEGKKVEKPLLQIQVHKYKGHLKPAA